MEKVILGLVLAVLGSTVGLFRLDSNKENRMNAGDHLTSTLGYFKATLKSKECSLMIENFSQEIMQYEQKGFFNSPSFNGECQYLEVSDGKVLTNAGQTYMEVSNEAHNDSTILTIDDEGVLRLVSTYIKVNRVDLVSTQIIFDDFKIDQPFLRAYSNLMVDFMTRVPAVSNLRKWKFIAEFGQMTIYFAENPAHKVDYVYSSIKIQDSQIFDFSGETFPGILFNNITFAPRCFQPRLYLKFKPPFVFEIDPYWPTLRVYEQGRYKLIDISYSKLSLFDHEPAYFSVHYDQVYSPCPPRTFQFKGDCVAECPAPFYHEMRGQYGRCVLNCEEYSPLNEEKRLCSCFTEYEQEKINLETIKKCPSSSKSTPYGCVCTKKDEFYDQKYTFDCVKKCPERTIGLNGLCMDCPTSCLECQIDGFYRNLLECKVCESGYLEEKGQCVKGCVSNHGLTLIDDACTACEDKNCVNCMDDPATCIQCNILSSLENGKCLESCAPGSHAVYSEYFDTKCIAATPGMCVQIMSSHYLGKPFLKCDMCMSGLSHLDDCVDSCPAGYYTHNDKYCACQGTKNITIHDECFDFPACPITMSFDIRSHSCLSCPYGCMSCINTQCTSCNPGYFLYISPQSILCRRKSPLFPCDQQYQWTRTTCRVKDFSNERLRMTECSTNIPNCEVCIPRSNQICVMCAENYYIYNNTCIDECPTGLEPYENTCILVMIENCAVRHFLSVRKGALLNSDLMEASHAYRHYIYGNRQPANDPIGYIPYFQKLTTQKSDGVPRQTMFFEPVEICFKCNDGFGLSEDLKSCSPCPDPCQTCYYAQNYSCLKKKGDNGGGGDGNQTNGTDECQGFIDEDTGNCIKSCSDVNKFPEVEKGEMVCKRSEQSSTKDYVRIDSSVYPTEEGKNLVIFVFGDKLNINSSNKKINVLAVSKPNSRMLTDKALFENETEIQNGEFIMIENGTADYYILNFTGKLTQLRSERNLFFPNQIYGTSTQQTHVQFMQSWLAHIGYIMSIVIICLHAVFIGNQLLYKVDNLLIFAQTIFYFSFVKNLAGRLLAQFYFGWSFSHAWFLPNIFAGVIPVGYREADAPVSYMLLNNDGNYFRNAGFSLGWMLIYIAAFGLIAGLVWGVLYKVKGKDEIWFPKMARQALIAGVEFFAMNLWFFSCSQLLYGYQGSNRDIDFFNSSQAMAIVTIIFLTIYTLLRISLNTLGGVYMIKRLLIATILAPAYNDMWFLFPALVLEGVFLIARYVLEAPDSSFERLMVLVQAGVVVGGYLLMFLCMDAGVNTIMISVIVFCWIVLLAYDLTTIYLESRHEYLMQQVNAESEPSEKVFMTSKIQHSKMASRIEAGSRQGSRLQYASKIEHRHSNLP